MCTSGAKFEEYCSNISRDILDLVFYCFSGTIYDVITFLICINLFKNASISKMKKKIFQKEKPFFFNLKSISNMLQEFLLNLYGK